MDPDYNVNDEEDDLTRNMAMYEQTIAMSIACGLSNSSTAKVMNALFVDLGLDLYVSAEKIRLLKAKYLKSLNQKHEKNTKELIAVGLDGKSGLVKTTHCQSIEQDKQSFIVSTTGQYLDHEIPERSTGEGICTAAYQVSDKTKLCKVSFFTIPFSHRLCKSTTPWKPSAPSIPMVVAQ